jgi:hypothetical protein
MEVKLKIIDIIALSKEILPESDFYISINKQDFLYSKILNKELELGNIQLLEIEIKRNSPKATIASNKIEVNKFLSKKLSAVTHWISLYYISQKNEDNIKLKIELSFKKYHNHIKNSNIQINKKNPRLIPTNSFKKLNDNLNKTPNNKNNTFKSKIRHYSTKEEKYSIKNYIGNIPNKNSKKHNSNIITKKFINKSFGNSENEENSSIHRELSDETLSCKRNLMNVTNHKKNSLTNSIKRKPKYNKFQKKERKYSTEEKIPKLMNFEKEIVKQNLYNINEAFINDIETEEIIPYLENDLFTLEGDEQSNGLENLSPKNIFLNIKNDFEIFYTKGYLNSLELNYKSLKLECGLCIEKAIDIILAYHNARKSIVNKRKKYCKILKVFIEKFQEIRKKKIKRENLIKSKEDKKLFSCNLKDIEESNNEIYKNNSEIELRFFKQFFQEKNKFNLEKKENLLQIFKQIYIQNIKLLKNNSNANLIIGKYFKEIKLILETEKKTKNLYKTKFKINNKNKRKILQERNNSYSNKSINSEQNQKKNSNIKNNNENHLE